LLLATFRLSSSALAVKQALPKGAVLIDHGR